MKKAKGEMGATATGSAGVIRIAVEEGSDVRWHVPLKYAETPLTRRIPGSIVTKLLCERDVQLRLTRFIQPPAERLGFHLA
jgi:hypothetical protein